MILVFMRYVKRVPGTLLPCLRGYRAGDDLEAACLENDWKHGSAVSLLAFRVSRFHISISICWRPLISPAIYRSHAGARLNPSCPAVVSDRMSGAKHNPNVELVGQGPSPTFSSPLFGGLSRHGERLQRKPPRISVPGAKNAGRRYMVHALYAPGDRVLFAAPLARFIPLLGIGGDSARRFPTNMGEWRERYPSF